MRRPRRSSAGLRREPAAAAGAAGQPQYQQPTSSRRRLSAAVRAARVSRTSTGSVPAGRGAAPAAAMGLEWRYAGHGRRRVRPSRASRTAMACRRLPIAEANGMTTGTPIYPGQRLVIPKYAIRRRPPRFRRRAADAPRDRSRFAHRHHRLGPHARAGPGAYGRPGRNDVQHRAPLQCQPGGARAGQRSAAASSAAHGRASDNSGCCRLAYRAAGPRPAPAAAAAPQRAAQVPAYSAASGSSSPSGRIPAGSAACCARHHARQGQSCGRRGQA